MEQSVTTTIRVRSLRLLIGAAFGAAAMASCSSGGDAQAEADPATDESTTSTANASGADSSSAIETTSTETTTTEPPPDTSTATEPPSTDTTRAAVINQAEPDLRFDYGQVDRFERVDGVDWIWFDRHGFGDQQGVELQIEPRWEMATDWHGGLNVNPKLRSYPLASNVRILELDPADYEAGCADLNLEWDFIESDLARLKALDDRVSLTFNEDNQVVLIRDQRTC